MSRMQHTRMRFRLGAMVLRFTGTLCIACLLGCGAAKPTPATPTSEMVQVQVDGVPHFAVRKAAMNGAFGQLVDAARTVLSIEPPAPAPDDDAPEAARKAWVATEYLPYLQAHVEAYGKLVAKLQVLPRGSLREQIFASAVLGWIAERHGRVLAGAPRWEGSGDDTADPFAQARVHYGACIDDASHAKESGEIPLSFKRLAAFCKERLGELPDPAAPLRTSLDRMERERPAPPPRWVNIPQVPGGGADTLPQHALALSVDARWVAFDAIRARTEADAVPDAVREWLQRRAPATGVLVFADRALKLGAAAPVLAAAAESGRAWLAFAREPTVAEAPEVTGAPHWYSSWRAHWRGATRAPSDRRARLLLLREAWMRVVGSCDAGHAMADALVEASPAAKWPAFRASWAPQADHGCCTCDNARDPAVAPVIGGLIELTAHTLRGPRVSTRRIRFAPTGSLPVGPDATFDELAAALPEGSGPLIWPAAWAQPSP